MERHIVYQKLAHVLLVGLIAGFVAAALMMGLCIWISTLPVISPVSLSLAFSPWWRERNWEFALTAFFLVGLTSVAIAAAQAQAEDQEHK